MDTKRAGRLSGIHTEPYGRSAAKNLVQGPRFFKREQISNGGPFWHRHIAGALRGITRRSSRWTIGLKALQAALAWKTADIRALQRTEVVET